MSDIDSFLRCLLSENALGDIGYQVVFEPDPREIPYHWRIVAKGVFQDSEGARATGPPLRK